MQELKDMLTLMVRYEKGVAEIQQQIAVKSNQRQKAIWNEDDETQWSLEGELVELGAALTNTRKAANDAKQFLLEDLGINPEELQPLFEPA